MEPGTAVGQSGADPELATCPVRHTPDTETKRTRADVLVRKILRIHERPAGASMASAHTAFQRSMAISATRCTLTYIFFPFVLPALGVATGVGPVIGIVIGVLAIGCDIFAVRRFFAIDHKWRWQVLAVVVGVICLLTVLIVQDVATLTT